MTDSTDPGVIETVVVTAADLVAALESGHRGADDVAVLRVTPPFSGRMRARLHVRQQPDAEDPASVILPAESFVEDDCPPPPEPDDVEDSLRADPEVTYTVDRHRERYRVALERWRADVPDYVRDTVQPTAVGEDVTISLLGTVTDE